MSYSNLTCYLQVPLQFALQDLTTDFFEFDAGHGCDRSMPYVFGICVFGNSGCCQILHQDFLLMQMDLCLDLKTIFQHACRNGVQITWFWRWPQNKLFNFIFWRTFKHLNVITVMSACVSDLTYVGLIEHCLGSLNVYCVCLCISLIVYIYNVTALL